MKKLIETIKSILHIETRSTAQLNCNYSDNYYGDQYCQPQHCLNDKSIN
ncbi:hypothetical protein L3081_07470 [Colwellia sp. MSW7]|uniref:Uncharacterized protein n=1 Tax=Colwellia maritima TaxID=2912588 RepID=A0ABS9WZC8_9GAMM|nr:hypothetical protein [Colwellia maritima]MCI2283269.1 hypothetical protein [Colwellia maritima]